MTAGDRDNGIVSFERIDPERRMRIVPPDAPQPGFGGPFHDGGMRHVIGLRGGLFLVLLVALLVVAIIALLLSMSRRRRDESRRGAGPSSSSGLGSGALRILDERLARGDLDVDEYTSRRKVLLAQES